MNNWRARPRCTGLFLVRTRGFFYQRSFQGATFAASPLRPEPLREGGWELYGRQPWQGHQGTGWHIYSSVWNSFTTSNQGPGTYARLKMRKDKDGLVSSVEVARIWWRHALFWLACIKWYMAQIYFRFHEIHMSEWSFFFCWPPLFMGISMFPKHFSWK